MTSNDQLIIILNSMTEDIQLTFTEKQMMVDIEDSCNYADTLKRAWVNEEKEITIKVNTLLTILETKYK